jgi:hypothetical protein
MSRPAGSWIISSVISAALRPAVSVAEVIPGSAGGVLPHAGNAASAGELCGAASPSTTRNCTALRLRLPLSTESAYAS